MLLLQPSYEHQQSEQIINISSLNVKFTLGGGSPGADVRNLVGIHPPVGENRAATSVMAVYRDENGVEIFLLPKMDMK
jgi:hypothetical protein